MARIAALTHRERATFTPKNTRKIAYNLSLVIKYAVKIRVSDCKVSVSDELMIHVTLFVYNTLK